jgi:hypothetical protein
MNKFHKDFLEKTRHKGNTWKSEGVDRRIILRWTLKTWYGAWNGLIRLMIGTGDGRM